MAKIKWSTIALDDLRTVYDYIAQDSPIYADRLLDKIIEKVDALEQHPLIGRKVPEFDDDTIRELLEGNYRIIYRVEADETIGISRIHHSARLLREL
ncbi:type II toxin-antitoxin system RelE/ParE family toxin [Cesiribacter andamanensis]|uniref:Toxin RelE2 n=1 Tax=Cesiribacter andamanensis AMV16 TaxID=1279009 RepID=M7N5C0_9BACT|nr:type II toxin-antitoxin system mRNA interferase toxin, RelE/StbE family [Cesiribacter andamanensis]EMR02492.1 Toxin RelE2 [Cesiribacter andamanensis AMV16]